MIGRIIAAIDPKPDDHIIEIGPGHGELTGDLLASGCSLTVIEIDRDLAAAVRVRYPGLNVIEADVLKVDFATLTGGGDVRIVGNLPYNISTPLLFKLFRCFEHIRDMHFMLQLEVVDRMVAGPDSNAYGRLSVMNQYYCEATKLFSVPATAFTPKPQVTSAIVRLTPRSKGPHAADLVTLEKIVNDAFSRRRKTIRNALRSWLSEDDLSALALDARLRPENLDVADYVRCANYIHERAPGADVNDP